ncbi:MAG: DNA polymerase IV [Bacteriovoracaceae bacterium]|nr:DNA polymerase IV [Bacteriovoracaceae bacterium]
MRKIIHLDMDCFFAAVEMREDPSLVGIPMAVGGSPTKRGVISTCNYEARKFGVRSAMSSAMALKLCPKLKIVNHHFSLYKEASDIVMDICHQYTDQVQSISLDEAYLDVTDSFLPLGSATLLAKEIRQKIFDQTKLTASAGIAPNKLLAKLASEVKKPNGQFTVSPDKIMEFMTPLPLSKIHGIGKVTSEFLKNEGFTLCSDILPLTRFELVSRFGRLGEMLYESCRGLDDREVETSWERKSLSVENTFANDLKDPTQMRLALVDLINDLKGSLEDYPEKKIHGLQVKIKYHDFKQTTIERAKIPINDESAWSLFLERWSQDPRPVRLIGVGVRFNNEIETPQLSFDAFELAV